MTEAILYALALTAWMLCIMPTAPGGVRKRLVQVLLCLYLAAITVAIFIGFGLVGYDGPEAHM